MQDFVHQSHDFTTCRGLPIQVSQELVEVFSMTLQGVCKSFNGHQSCRKALGMGEWAKRWTNDRTDFWMFLFFFYFSIWAYLGFVFFYSFFLNVFSLISVFWEEFPFITLLQLPSHPNLVPTMEVLEDFSRSDSKKALDSPNRSKYAHRIHGTGIFAHYEWLIFMVNVGKYTIHGSFEFGYSHQLGQTPCFFWCPLEKTLFTL